MEIGDKICRNILDDIWSDTQSDHEDGSEFRLDTEDAFKTPDRRPNISHLLDTPSTLIRAKKTVAIERRWHPRQPRLQAQP